MGAAPGTSVAYCTAAELKPFIDKRTLATLLSDTGTPLAGDPFTDTTNLPDILLAACGDLESALLVGAKYTADDLMNNLPTATRKMMIRIIAGLVMTACRDRRGIVTEKEPQISKYANDQLKAIRSGYRILSLAGVQDARAGMTARDESITARYQRQDYVSRKNRFYGTR